MKQVVCATTAINLSLSTLKIHQKISINRGYKRGWFGAGRMEEDGACLNKIESFVCKVCKEMPTDTYKGPINSLSYHVRTNNMMNHCN